MKLLDFTGARRIPLIGRHSLLQEASRRLRKGGTHLLYFEGEGGIGKTALLEAILERSQLGGDGYSPFPGSVADEIIDLYHVDVHTPEGLIRRIVQVLDTPHFHRTRQQLNTLDWARSVGDLDAVSEKPSALHKGFLEEFAAQAEEGIVLAFDTMEVLEYERDPFQAKLGKQVPILGTGEWLFESFFPALQGNVLILLAGRPDGVQERLRALLQRNPLIQFRSANVKALQEEETVEYLKAVAHLEGQRGDFDAATRLWDFAEERGDAIHILTGGRPIMLALVADMVAQGWTLPSSFGCTAQELSEQSAAARALEVESALIVRIQESPSPIGEVIHALAWLRKGATPALLARVMDLSTGDGTWNLQMAQDYLDQVAHLTLVKVRSGDGRVFLHDELYALMEKHVLQECSLEERDRVYRAVLHYYDDLASDLERRIDRTSYILPLIHARSRQAYVEQMHYRLRYRPSLGFAMYFWLAEEALSGRDAEMDMLLRSELLRTVRLLNEFGFLEGLDPLEVELDTAVRWGMRALFLQNDPEGALAVFDRIQETWEDKLETLELPWMHMQLYRAAAKIERAEEDDWREARELLRGVEQAMDRQAGVAAAPPITRGLYWWAQIPQAPPAEAVIEGRHWLSRTLKALALNFEGYLDQQQGRYAEAVKHLQASAMLQRRLAMAGLAPTLTHLSFTMARMGQFQNARLLAQEAERWARHSGKEYVLALALNARALVEEYDNHHRDALRYTEQALKIAEGLRDPRVRGLLYLTRARAHRYLLLSEEDRDREPQSLDEALKEANQAINLLKNNPRDRITALIERGCMLREMARGHYLQQRGGEANQAVRGSQRDLERAALLAGALGLLDQQAAAWTSLGWLWYYAGQIGEANAALDQVYSIMPPDYLLRTPSALPPIVREGRESEACLPLWSTLGQAEMLRAYLALDQDQAAWSGREREQQFHRVVGHITLSLTYNEQIADEHFDMTRAESTLHRRILQDKLSIAALHQHAQQVAEETGLQQPTRFQRFLDRMFGPAELWGCGGTR